jgi:hypothetical protein
MGFFSGKPKKRAAPRRAVAQVKPAGFDSETKRAMAELQAKTAAHIGIFHLDESEWSLEQSEGVIEFIDRKRGMLASASAQILGSWNSGDSTWLWAWQNPSIRDALTADARKMKSYGSSRNYSQLITSKFKCDEKTAWQLAALSCMICEQQGVYRGPAGETRVFIAFGELSIRKLPGGK